MAVDVYDVDGAGNATLISRGTTLLPNSGSTDLELYGNDWKLPAGHRIGVLVTSSNAEWWAHVPTGQTVTVKGGSVSLPFLTCARDATIQGDPSIKLEDYKAGAPFAVDSQTISEGTASDFALPPALTTCG
jgi:hypothetical protein